MVTYLPHVADDGADDRVFKALADP
ncbi:MAG: hypothetical protein QOK35_952, partial [Pseudonocardiales bacterium]|nr:hypothetical protein [Pseudonocardiales bacterium]